MALASDYCGNSWFMWHFICIFVRWEIIHGFYCKHPSLSIAVKEFWKSVEIWQSYRHEFGGTLFWDTVYSLYASELGAKASDIRESQIAREKMKSLPGLLGPTALYWQAVSIQGLQPAGNGHKPDGKLLLSVRPTDPSCTASPLVGQYQIIQHGDSDTARGNVRELAQTS